MDQRTREQASVRIVFLVLGFFVLGIGVSAFWFSRATKEGSVNVSQETNRREVVVLSDGTKAVLHRLDSPVEIRFYSLLDPASVPDSSQAYSRRVDRLLSAFQDAGNGKIKVVRYNSQSDFNAAADAASADGIQPFNLDKGNACYLGLTVFCNGQKESLSRLAPQWEQALEADLSRAIEHVAGSKSPTKPLSNNPPTDAAAIEEVKRALPNFASVPVEEGTRILREAALKDFKAAADEMEVQVREAQERLGKARNGGSEAEQQAAMKHLEQIQAEQSEKIKQIAARAQAQIEAFRQLKGITH
jgi:ABC-type uncharacterized transport system